MKSTIELTDEMAPTPPAAAKPAAVRKKIWIDLDNSPHVPFFVPIMPELKAKGFELFITARDSYQVVELLKYYGVQARVIGKHYGKNKILKFLGTVWRAMALIYVARKEKIDISVTHGSRGCLIASAVLGIQNITIVDYEHTAKFAIKNMVVIYPEIIPTDGSANNKIRILKYPGIKEDVYLPSFHPDPQLRLRLGIVPDELLVTVRPPASEAHYHNPEAEGLLTATLEKFCGMPGARVLLLPRNKNQEKELRAIWTKEVASGKIVIPAHVEDGMNIIWNSDLVVSGGGTMNREAAAMGVPVYSIFRGPIGAVDRFLSSQGRLVLLESVEQVNTKIRAVRRNKEILSLNHQKSPALETIVKHITDVAESMNLPAQGRRKG
jgi:predicted glycosyltransferase